MNHTRKRLAVLIEDNEEQLTNIEAAMKRSLSGEQNIDLVVARNAQSALEQLEVYRIGYPSASVFGIFDLNMGHNPHGNQRPTESLFTPESHAGKPYADALVTLLYNPGVVIFHTGYPEQLRTSDFFLRHTERFPAIAFGYLQKGDLPVQSVTRIIKLPEENIPDLQRRIVSAKYDLKRALEGK